MVEHEAVEVGIVGVEMACGVEGVVVFDDSADFHLMRDSVFNDGAEGVLGPAWREREFGVAVCHAFRADED